MTQYSKFIQKQRKIYREIGSIVCPALYNERVYFNNYGFNHLFRKNGNIRPIDDIHRRLNILQEAVYIIQTSPTISEYRISHRKNIPAHFWAIQGKVGNQNIKVILRKIDKGKLHFFSVYS